MKKSIISIFLLLCICTLSVNAQAATHLVPGGQVVGLELSDGSVTIAGFDGLLGQKAKEAGLKEGDCILQMNGKPIRCAEDVRQALDRSSGNVTVDIRRQDRMQQLSLQPEITKDGPKLGIFLKQGTTGVGTVTWYDPDTGKFGTLGHGVSSSNGELLNMVSGTAYVARVASVKPGKSGQPGQLRGAVESGEVAGQLYRNTEQGLFGTTDRGISSETVEVAKSSEIKTGPAVIRSTVEGDTVREYSVEILKIYPRARMAGRNLLIRVTDPALLEATGGIVQGMSGSPIIQDGKLIGAVTHVLVNSPDTGYGIFIENMLDAAG